MSPITTVGTLSSRALLALALALASSCKREAPPTSMVLAFPGLAFRVEVTPALASRLSHSAGLAQNTLDAMRANFDDTNPGSDISRINRMAATVELPIQPTTYQFLFHAKRLHEATGGAFDISTAPIAYAWGFKGGPPPTDLPDRLVDTIRFTFGMEKLSIREFSATLRYEANSLDAHGMLAGFLTDHMVKRLRDNLLPDFILRSESVARALGTRGPGDPWTIQLDHPVNRSAKLGVVRLQSGQACGFVHAFSDFREVAGRKISHVIDPTTGRPVDATLLAVALAPSATDAQALATAALVRGAAGASALLASLERCHLLVVSNEATPSYFASPGFREQFEAADGFGETLRDLPPIPEKKPTAAPLIASPVSTNTVPAKPAP